MCQCGTVSLLLLLLTAIPLYAQEESSSSSSSTTSVPIQKTTSSSIEDEGFDPNKDARCFEFTWLGSNYDNSIEFDKTCEDFLSENKIVNHGVCRQPFVITNNSYPPDLRYLYEHKKYKPRVLRRQRLGEVCAKFSYLFNNEVMNITYLRTKVYAEGEGPVTSGCYTQIQGSIESELCVCIPRVGDYFPCNSSPGATPALVNAAIVAAITALACTLTRRLI